MGEELRRGKGERRGLCNNLDSSATSLTIPLLNLVDESFGGVRFGIPWQTRSGRMIWRIPRGNPLEEPLGGIIWRSLC